MLARHYTTGGYATAIFPLGEYGPLQDIYCRSRIFRMNVIFVYFVRSGFRTNIKIFYDASERSTKQVRVSAVVSDCTKISCVRKVGEPRIRKLSAYEIFWIHSARLRIQEQLTVPNGSCAHVITFFFFWGGGGGGRGESGKRTLMQHCSQLRLHPLRRAAASRRPSRTPRRRRRAPPKVGGDWSTAMQHCSHLRVLHH